MLSYPRAFTEGSSPILTTMPKLKVPGQKRSAPRSAARPTKKPCFEKSTARDTAPGSFNRLFGPSDDEVDFEGFASEDLPTCFQKLDRCHLEKRQSPIPSSSSSSSSSVPSSRSSSPAAQLTLSGQLRKRRVRCTKCPACLRQDDCGKCPNCK